MKRSSVSKTVTALIACIAAGLLLSLAAGWIFSKGLLFDFRFYSPYVIKIYLKENWQNIITGGLICSLVIFLLLKKDILLNIWVKITHNMSKTSAFRLLLILTVTLLFLIVYGGYIFGGRYFLFTDAGMDTIYQFYPMYVHLVNEIREGTLSLWNFDWGLGCDTLTRQEWIMDPCAWLAVVSGLLFGIRSIRHMLLITQFIKVMACALICFEFLGYYKFSLKARFTASCLFGFNSWLMLWGQHYYFGMACVYLILLLYAVEKMLYAYRQNCGVHVHYAVVGIITALIFMYSVYFGYMIVIFTSVYTIMRMLYLGYGDENAGTKTLLHGLWHELWPVTVSVILGMVCAGVMIIPYADIVLNVSTRVEGSFLERIGRYAAALYDGGYYKTLAGRAVSNNMFGILALDQKYYEFPQLAFSTFNLLVIPQVFWFGIIKAKENVSRCKRALRLAMAVLLLLVLVWPFAGAVFNIGVGESLVENIPAMRFTFVLMPLLAVIYAYFCDKCITGRRVNVIFILLGIAAVYAVSYYAFWNYRIHYRWVNGALAALNPVFGAMLVLLCTKKAAAVKNFAENTAFILLILIIGSSCFDAYITNEMRYTYDNKTECMAEDFHGSATMKVLDRIKSDDDSFYRVEKIYYDFSNTGDSLIQDYSPLSMYCSTMSGYLKRFYEAAYPIPEYEYPNTDVEYTEFDNAFAIANVKYIITIFPLAYDFLEPVCEISGVYAYRNKHAGSIGTVYNNYMSYSDFEKTDGDEKKNLLGSVLLLPDDAAAKLPKASAADTANAGTFPNRSSYFTKKKDSYIMGNVNAGADGMLMLSIPYRNGWNVYIDGIRQKSVNADYGFMAVEITKGRHEVTVKYENVLYASGAAVSLVGALLMSVWIIFIKYKRSGKDIRFV